MCERLFQLAAVMAPMQASSLPRRGMNDATTTPKRTVKHDALDVFVGDWRAEGLSFGGPKQYEAKPRDNPTEWKSTHTARWHTGKFFLVHDERAQVDGPFDTLAIFGWEEDKQSYFVRSIENHGYYREYTLANDGLVWLLNGPTERARIEFSDDGNHQRIAWEWKPKTRWLPLCDRIATRVRRDA